MAIYADEEEEDERTTRIKIHNYLDVCMYMFGWIDWWVVGLFMRGIRKEGYTEKELNAFFYFYFF